MDARGDIVGKYRKVHLPGHCEFDTERAFQHLEKRYFEPGDLGFPGLPHAWAASSACASATTAAGRRPTGSWACRAWRWSLLGYNTPSVNSQKSAEGPSSACSTIALVVQAGAYQNSTWVVSVAKAGDEDGHPLIGGSLIVNPDGEIVAQAEDRGRRAAAARMRPRRHACSASRPSSTSPATAASSTTPASRHRPVSKSTCRGGQRPRGRLRQASIPLTPTLRWGRGACWRSVAGSEIGVGLSLVIVDLVLTTLAVAVDVLRADG